MESSDKVVGENNESEGKVECKEKDDEAKDQKQEDEPKAGEEKNDDGAANDNKPLSKNQLRKKRRREALEAKNLQRKLQAKEAKRIKAIAAGRDLEKEKKEQEERAKTGEGRKRREEHEKEKFQSAQSSFGVCIDCSYEDQMTDKEINSLALQIRYCYAANKRAKKPCRIYVSSLSGKTNANLCNVSGYPERWIPRAFTPTEQNVTQLFPDTSNLVYLTSDSPNTLERLENDKIYVIGGIVDRNRLKRAAFLTAEKYQIPTAKLPISEYVKVGATKVLTCNHVFEILIQYQEYGGDWKRALIHCLPQRKEVQLVDQQNAEQAQQSEEQEKDSQQ